MASGGRTGNSFMHEHGYAAAFGLGVLMVGVGTILAAAARPESALIWWGGILAVAGVFGDRIRSFKVGSGGAEATLDPGATVAAVLDAKRRERETERAARLIVPEAASPYSLPIGGSYWSDPVMKKATLAASSNSSAEFGVRLAELLQAAAEPDAFIAGPTQPAEATKRSLRRQRP